MKIKKRERNPTRTKIIQKLEGPASPDEKETAPEFWPMKNLSIVAILVVHTNSSGLVPNQNEGSEVSNKEFKAWIARKVNKIKDKI